MRKHDSNDITLELLNFLSSLTEEQWSTKITENWDTHDVVAHLVGWLEECIKEFPKAWETKTDPWFMHQDYSAFNENNVQKYRGWSHKTLIKKYKQVNDEFNALIESIGEETIRKDKRFGWVLDEGDDNHELHHLNQIKKVLGFGIQELYKFGREIIDILNQLDVQPVVYGSLAYFYHTKDNRLPINDIDLLVPESCFPLILEILDRHEATYEVMPYHSIEVFQNDMKIDIDSTEHFLYPRSGEYTKASLGGIEFNFLNIDSLISIYEEALKNMPADPKLKEKREQYQNKIANLKRLSSKI